LLSQVKDVKKDERSQLWPGELVTIGGLYALTGQSQRRFFRMLFPELPERSWLFRLLRAHQKWSEQFLDDPGMINVSDSPGIELIVPKRQGRSPKQIGQKGISNGRWIVGVKFCPMINLKGRIFDRDAKTGNVYDGDFQRMLTEYPDEPELVDSGFHRSKKRGGDCENLVVCQRGQRNYRMVVESVFSGLTEVFGMKKIRERIWPGIESHLGFACATWNLVTDMARELFGGDKASLSTAWVPI
jgi:hypothetical protein